MGSYNDVASTINDDDFANMEDVSETCDEGQRPHEGVDTINLRDTPLKRNALASKNKSTFRGTTRRTSKNPSPRKSHLTADSSQVTATFEQKNSSHLTNNSLIVENQASSSLNQESMTPVNNKTNSNS